jgi:hypothetical protein
MAPTLVSAVARFVSALDLPRMESARRVSTLQAESLRHECNYRATGTYTVEAGV